MRKSTIKSKVLNKSLFLRFAFVSFAFLFVILTPNNVYSQQFTLTIQKNGTGSGRIKSALENPPRIDCGVDCTEVYAQDTVVFFDIIPDPGSAFSGWSGTPGCPTSPNEGVLMISNLN